MTMMSDDNLRKAGLKVTTPRLKILEILEKSPQRHMNAEEIYRQLLNSGEEVGLATVYRVLAQFEDAGLVSRLNFENGHSVFEIKAEDHHDHLVCLNCGLVEEFFDEVIEKHQAEIAKKRGFVIADHALTLYGICQYAESDRCPKRLNARSLSAEA
jgi:Fur family transcriptional regulator, ferric uptake regulator